LSLLFSRILDGKRRFDSKIPEKTGVMIDTT